MKTAKKNISREERFGLLVSVFLHLLVVIFTWMMVSKPEAQGRMAFIEVTLGEFQTGTPAQFAPEPRVEPETRIEPVEAITEDPAPEPAEELTPEPQPEEPSRDVELPEQQQEVESEVVTTPETERVDPAMLAEQTEQEQEPAPPQPAQRDETETRGEQESGDIRGIRGRVNADQGTGTDPIRSAPYQLEWEGDFQRAAVVQPLPAYVSQVEAVIRVRFEVRPDGTIGRLQPMIRGNPELDQEVLRTLREWRFSRLPSHVPQESQYGVITFRFVLE